MITLWKMLELFLIIFIVIIVTSLCLHHHSMEKKLFLSINQDADLIHKAAEKSVQASNTLSPLLAHKFVTQAIEIVELSHARHGSDRVLELTGVDSQHMHNVLKEQEKKIVADILQIYPDMLQPHIFREHMVKMTNPVPVDTKNAKSTP